MVESKVGWIKLHRKLTDNWIWQDPEKLRAWIDILLMVNHEDKEVLANGKVITVKSGQKLTSIVQLADRWGWSRHRVYRFLALLKANNMCNTNGTANGTLITVVNWAFYQLDGTPNGTTLGTPDGTAVGTSVGTQTRMNKNDKNDKKGVRAHERGKRVKDGITRKKDLDAWLKEQTQKLVGKETEKNEI